MLDVNLSVGLLTLMLFGLLILTLLSGLPLAFSLGGTAVIFTVLFWGSKALFMFPAKALGTMQSIVMVAVPLFIFMGATLARSGLADDLYDMAYHLIGRIRGGLAAGTVGICAVFAAMTGASAPATVTMGIVALPSMLKRGYKPSMAVGSIAAGGALGILIPPSITMIVYSLVTGVSVGHLFMGGVIPGILLTTMFMVYIFIRCFFQKSEGPAISREEQGTWKERLASLRAVVLPILLVIMVLGSIYTGIATPTEAAAVGATGGLIVVAIYRKLTKAVMWDILKETVKLTTMVLWIVMGGYWFASVYTAIGASNLMLQIIEGLPFGPIGIVLIMQLTFFILGMLMDPTGIIFITMPVYAPIIMHLGFDPLWFGILFIVNMEMAYLTPPFGLNLFYLKAIVPKEISMGQICRAAIPFILIQATCLGLLMAFPNIVLWLPSLMIR